jgi:hypothetical protein
MPEEVHLLFSKDYTDEQIRRLIKQFRDDCEEWVYDIWGDYYNIRVDSYFEHEDDELRNGCMDIFGVKLLSIMDGADTVLLDKSYLRIIDNLLKLRHKKGIRILLLIRFMDQFRKYVRTSSNWYGKNSSDIEEQGAFKKSKEIFEEIEKLDLAMSDEETKIIKENYVNLDSAAMIYYESSEHAQY